MIDQEEMQRYAEQLIAFSEGTSKHATSLVDGTFTQGVKLTHSPTSSRAMGASDAFGAVVAEDREHHSAGPQISTPRHYAASGNLSVVADEHVGDQEERETGSTYSEAETDGETDDEPTIRPDRSCSSSETQSLCSNDTNEDSEIIEDEDDGEHTGDDRHSMHSNSHWSGDNDARPAENLNAKIRAKFFPIF